MESVKGIREELVGNERKVAESLGHSREIGRLLELVELDMGRRGEELRDTGEKLAITSSR